MSAFSIHQEFFWTDFLDVLESKVWDKDELNEYFIENFPKVCKLIRGGKPYYISYLGNNEFRRFENLPNIKIKINIPAFIEEKTVRGKIVRTEQPESEDIIPLKLLYFNNSKDIPNYNREVFKPNNVGLEKREVNLWLGFISDPKIKYEEQEKTAVIALFTTAVFTLLGEEVGNWYIDRLAHIMRKPYEKTLTCPILISQQGTGKSKLSDFIIQKLIGEHLCLQISGLDRITQKHNCAVSGKLWIQFEEMPALRDEFIKQFEVLKTMITENSIYVEPKGFEGFTISNMANFSVNTNHKNSIKIEPSDRRYVPINVSDELLIKDGEERDESFWAAYIDNVHTKQGGDIIHKWLLDRQIPSMVGRQIKTSVHKELIDLGLPSPIRFLNSVKERLNEPVEEKNLSDRDTLDIVVSSIRIDGVGKKCGRIQAKRLFELFKIWCKEMNEKDCSNTKFGSCISSEFNEETKRTIKGTVYYCFE